MIQFYKERKFAKYFDKYLYCETENAYQHINLT